MAKKYSTSVKALVVLCSCGDTLGKVVEFERLERALKQYPGVVGVIRSTAVCSNEGQKALLEQLRATGADSLVLAGCSPRTHENTFEPLFSGMFGEPVIPAFRFEHVGIREQCEWVHSESGAATNKALWLIAGALGKLSAAATLVEFENKDLVFNKDIAIIGGGAAGLHASALLAGAGLKVQLIEKSHELGGRAFKLHLDDPDRKLLPDINRIREHPNIKLRTGTEVVGIAGGLGHYNLKLGNGEEITAGGIIIATGSDLFDSNRIGAYRSYLPGVLNSFELDRLLVEQKSGLSLKVGSGPAYTPSNIHFIQCVGSRDENFNPYCSLICCTIALKQALELKKRLPGSNVYVHYMDMRGPYVGFEEKFIAAQEIGVMFSRGRIAEIVPAENIERGHTLELRGESVELDEVFAWPADLVVLSVGFEPSKGAERLSDLLFFPRDRDSFNIEHNYHIDLKDRRGVAFIGNAVGPRFIRHALADARRAAFEFMDFFGDRILSRDVRSVIDESRCAGCGTCVELCPYKAITLETVFDYKREQYKKLAVVDINSCQGCGACASGCPSSVPTLQKYGTEQLWRQIEELMQ